MSSKKLLLDDMKIRNLGIKTFQKKEAILNNSLPETYIHPYRTGYVLWCNGIGDFIVFARALQWIADNCPHIYGVIFCPGALVEYYRHLFAEKKHWSIDASEIANCIDPNWFHPQIQVLIDPWRNGKTQFFTAQGAHPLDLGFAYYANMGHLQIPPEYNNYPRVDLARDGLSDLLGFEADYAVITPGAVRNTGTVPGHNWNPILSHIKASGLTPVILGKSEVTEGYGANLPPGIDLSGCANLWDKTSLMQAAQVIQFARVVIGLDNGLLHLAGCTETPIVFGYNVTSVELRRPRRECGKIFDVFLTKEELACIGCVTDVKAHLNHEFNRACLYEKFPEHRMACVRKLFENGGKRWIEKIEEALK